MLLPHAIVNHLLPKVTFGSIEKAGDEGTWSYRYLEQKAFMLKMAFCTRIDEFLVFLVGKEVNSPPAG